VLGGSSFVGGAVVDAALAGGWGVTTFNRGSRPEDRPGVEVVVGDRTRRSDVERLAGDRWDVVVDTWAAAPRVVRTSAGVLRDVAGRYVYVSSRAVYASPYPGGLDETAATVEASAGAESTGYAEDKRGGELAVEEAFGDRALLVRAGVILGPGENLGRMRCWLAHVDRSSTVLAPGDPDQPWRFVDVHDARSTTASSPPTSAGRSRPDCAAGRCTRPSRTRWRGCATPAGWATVPTGTGPTRWASTPRWSGPRWPARPRRAPAGGPVPTPA